MLQFIFSYFISYVVYTQTYEKILKIVLRGILYKVNKTNNSLSCTSP